RWGFSRWMARSIRVEPRVQLEAALVGFRDSELQRIVPRIRRPTHSSGEILRPRLVWRCVKCVGSGSNLQNYGIQPERSCAIQNAEELVFLVMRREAPL